MILFSIFISISFSIFKLINHRFQGKNQEEALHNLYTLYWPILKANWTYLSLLVFINIRFVPPIVSIIKSKKSFKCFNWKNDSISQFRVLIGNLVGFGWVIFITMKRRKLQHRIDTANNTRIVVTDSESESSSGTTKKKPRGKDN